MHFNRVFLCLLCVLLVFGGCDKASATNTAAEQGTACQSEGSFLDTLTFLGDSTTAHMLLRAPLKDGKQSKQIWATKAAI